MTADRPEAAADREEARGAAIPAQDTRLVNRAGVQLLVRFHGAYKAARIYEPNNEMFQDRVDVFARCLERLSGGAPETVVRVRFDSFFVNGIRLKYNLAAYGVLKSVLETLRARGIGGLAFREGWTRDELGRFILALARRERTERSSSFADVVSDLREAGVVHVAPEQAIELAPAESFERTTARIYFLSILHLRESFERDGRDERISLTTTRRLMQTIINHITENVSFSFGLTNVKNHDEYTLNHSVNVCVLSIALGRRLGLSRAELVELAIAAFFHDLGKLETPLDILNKPARLSDEEREIMEQHPYKGARKLIHLREFRSLPLRSIHVALEHHIKEDFTGYPRYFKRDSVNLFSKIVKITDYYDAITTARVYRKKVFGRAEALRMMLEQSGTEFNPVILKAFAGLMGTFPVGTLVALDTDELAVVTQAGGEAADPLRPRVKLVATAAGDRVDGETVELTERDAATGRFLRSIVKDLAPEAYGIRVSDYFLAQAR